LLPALALGTTRLSVKLACEFANVRFGSKADICAAKSNVRFTPNSGHETAFRDLSNLMSALVPKMSALTPIADIRQCEWNVCFGPIADIDCYRLFNDNNLKAPGEYQVKNTM
jgi:hypothetical protein